MGMRLQNLPPKHLSPANIGPEPRLPPFSRGPGRRFQLKVEEIADETQKAFAWGGVHDWHQRLHDLKTRSLSMARSLHYFWAKGNQERAKTGQKCP
jgi:hypothetical protein